MAVQNSPFGFVVDQKRVDELVRRIAEEVCGLRITKAIVVKVQQRLEDFKIQLDATTSESPKQIRDAMEELAVALRRAAIAVASAPQEPDFFEVAVRRETGFGSTTLSNVLHRLSEETSQGVRKFRVPRARNVSDQKLCAYFTRLLFDDLSEARPTLTPNGAFVTAASLLAELFLGDDESRSMTSACREVLEGQFPKSPDL
jgi:hypothetical protein